MNLDKALALIKEFEGCKLKAYQDVGGIWTIGYGTTGHDIVEGLEITPEQANVFLEAKAGYFSKEIKNRLSDLNENQHCALVSFTYNVGLGNFLSSTMYKMLRPPVVSPPPNIADQFLRWNKVRGEVVAGLTRRREAERALFLEPST